MHFARCKSKTSSGSESRAEAGGAPGTGGWVGCRAEAEPGEGKERGKERWQRLNLKQVAQPVLSALGSAKKRKRINAASYFKA